MDDPAASKLKSKAEGTSDLEPESRLLAGWGRTSACRADVVAPTSMEEVEGIWGSARLASLVPRGLGRSYGDAAQCSGGTVLDMTGLNQIKAIESSSREPTGAVHVGAGASVHDLICWGIPNGWFVPVTPGTRQVTMGGALAADVHGKNHHVDGSFSCYVEGFTLSTPVGTFRVTAESEPDLFWATAGGMGLTGVVTDMTVRMLRVETSSMVVDTQRFADLDAVMAEMETTDASYRYSVAWVDCMARRGHLGRAVLTRGDHAKPSDLSSKHRANLLRPPSLPRLGVPAPAPRGLLNPLTVAVFNEAWYRKAPRRAEGEVHSISSFFHPLDGVSDWNLLYGPSGFLQYQFVVGFNEGDALRRIVELFSSSGLPSFLAVLKRFGPGSPGPLSFPIEGWTLALDFPLGPRTLHSVLDQADEIVASAGGRVYLAKDSRLSSELLTTMYPKIGELTSVRSRVDPAGRLCSDLSRRLGIG